MSARRTAIILAVTALALSRSKAFMLETSTTTSCRHVNIHERKKNNPASLLSSSSLWTDTLALPSAAIFSHRPQFKRRRKEANSLTINHAVMRKEEEEDYERSISSIQLNNSTIFYRTNRNEELFQKRLTELQDFRLNHGHGSIPTPYPSNPSLGIWAANVRQQYSLWKRAEERGSPYMGYLTQSRRHRLQLAGFDFASLTERQFRTRLKELEMFKEKYGHCMVPEKWEENVALGAWVSNLRSLYKKRMMMMVQQQRRQEQSQQHHDGEGIHQENSDEPQSKIKNQKQRRNRRILLQSSSHNLRKKRQRLPRFSHLDENRIQVLEEMGFVWSSIDRKWFEMLEWAKVYGVVNHAMKLHCVEDEAGDNDPTFVNKTIPADWYCSSQRNNHNHSLLLENYLHFVQNIQNQSLLPSFHPQDRILELLSEQTPLLQPTSLLPQTDASDVSTISSSLDYRIRRNDPLHQPLRIWMINQRSNYNRLDHSTNQTHVEFPESTPSSTLSARRQQALEAIYFPWSGRFRSRVEELRHEQEVMERMERQQKRERKMEQKKRDEQERVEQLTSSIVASVSLVNNDMVELGEADTDIMTLWGEEDDDDDDDDDEVRW